MADKQAALDRALDEQEDLLLLYQPIHDATTREIIAAEALLRQRRESGEIREASIITAAAEDAPPGDLFALDSIVIEKAFRDAARWQQRAPNVRLHVNLSPREFQEGQILPRLAALVAGCGVNTRRLTIEITETSYIEHPEQTMHILEELKQLGIQLWLDDFGTGHSTLTHLQKFPVDGIKVPADFIRGLDGNKRCRAIVKALINVAHEIGTKVIAEGVEQEKQREALLRWGCDAIQGFLFSRPMTLDRLETTLR